MGFRDYVVRWLAPGLEERYSSKDPYVAEMLGGRSTFAGEAVSADNAIGVAAVHACVQLISETVASLPLFPFRRLGDGGREADRSHSLYKVLHEQPNQVQSAMEFREQLVASCLLTGNGYARKVIDGRGAVRELLPLHPQHVQPEMLTNGRVRYLHRRPGAPLERLTQDEVLHLRYRTVDGFTGLSPVTVARETISVAIAQQRYEGSFYRNGARPTGVLTHPKSLGKETIEKLRTQWDQLTKSGGLVGTAILEEGLEFKTVSLSQKDSEFVEARMLNLEDVARIFRVPPPAIGILRDATYSNITEQQRSLVMHTLRPWLVRIEQAMNRTLLTDSGRRTHFIEHNADGLLRGSIEERYNAYRVGREWGWLSANEIRQKENMNGIGEEGDGYREPMNTQPLGFETQLNSTSE